MVNSQNIEFRVLSNRKYNPNDVEQILESYRKKGYDATKAIDFCVENAGSFLSDDFSPQRAVQLFLDQNEKLVSDH